MGKQTSSIRWPFWRWTRRTEPVLEPSPGDVVAVTGLTARPGESRALESGCSSRGVAPVPHMGAAFEQNPISDPAAAAQRRYLLERDNGTDAIHKLDSLLRMPRVILEIGCGDADAARRIAQKNPDMGVVATDRFGDFRVPAVGSGYAKFASAWRENRLPVQMAPLPNLVVLRAEADLLACLPARSVDTVLLVNPEPSVGRAFLAQVRNRAFSSRIKHGPKRVVILPFSREMGVCACGGFGFDHDPDWSRGLGFIMGSGLAFRPARSEQWGVDLTTLSAYTRSSTQRQVYAWGDSPA